MLNSLRAEYYESLESILDEPRDCFEYEKQLDFIDVIKKGYPHTLVTENLHAGLTAGSSLTAASLSGLSGLFSLASVATLGLSVWKRYNKPKEPSPQIEQPKDPLKKDQQQLIVFIGNEKKRCYPGQRYLETISQHKAKRFQQRSQQEARMTPQDDYQDLLRNQIASWEQYLRETFLHKPDFLIDSILSAAREKDERIILEEHFATGNKHSIFIIELWVRALRRLSENKDTKTCQWICKNFSTSVTRHRDEHHLFLDTLASKSQNLPLFVSEFRKIRNLIMHGDGEGVSFQKYQEWCDFAYGTSSLLQWLDIGVSPNIYPSKNFGWLSFLITACAQK